MGPSPDARAAATPAAAPGGPLDVNTLRTRWPDVLAAVQRERRVAAIQLSNASVESFADGVLTLAFAQAGFARGFQTGGYDTDLVDVLAAMFGIRPQVRTTVGTAGSTSSGGTAPAGGTGKSASAAVPRGAESGPAKGARARNGRSAAEAAPEPADHQDAPNALTGMSLIERELGGTVIEESEG